MFDNLARACCRLCFGGVMRPTCQQHMQGSLLRPVPIPQPFRPLSRSVRRSRRVHRCPPSAVAVQDIVNTIQSSPVFSGAVATTVVGALAAALWGLSQASTMAEGSQPGLEVQSVQSSQPTSRKDAVLVFGASGRLGKQVVAELVGAGRHVVATSHKADKLEQAFAGETAEGPGHLYFENCVDITDSAALMSKELWQGISQVVTTVGPAFGRQPDGGMGYIDNMTSERVDAEGISNIAKAAEHFLPAQRFQPEVEQVLSMRSAADLEVWEKLDDTIMGGKSGSYLQTAEDLHGFQGDYKDKQPYDFEGSVWRGETITDGGGFCGARTKMLDLNLQRFDGISLRVKGDGQTYKFNLKTADQMNVPESTYQAQYDTIDGEWVTVYMPWHEFVPVTRAQYDSKAKPLDPAQVKQIGLVLSRFHYNSLPNQRFKPGNFELQIADGIAGFKHERPCILMVSSAAVERNAIIGDDLEARKKDIPIVQLNPGGTLNHKYTGETAVRGSGLPYSVLRSTGITDKTEGGPFLLEAYQGDTISGNISRHELARLVVTALSTPEATGKTIEVRRSEAADAKGKSDSAAQLQRLFYSSTQDRSRAQIGLAPMPKPVPPPPPPTEERTKEILADDRVQAVQSRERKERSNSNGNGASSNGVQGKQSRDSEARGAQTAVTN
ncbi:MAG: hypothetical protein FRX49_04376 [Trebouxia sp. A1-2]|nr:MAG: hypothetical protein FRX49_04376 [Trebouxia sp. A1-2]